MILGVFRTGLHCRVLIIFIHLTSARVISIVIIVNSVIIIIIVVVIIVIMDSLGFCRGLVGGTN